MEDLFEAMTEKKRNTNRQTQYQHSSVSCGRRRRSRQKSVHGLIPHFGVPAACALHWWPFAHGFVTAGRDVAMRRGETPTWLSALILRFRDLSRSVDVASSIVPRPLVADARYRGAVRFAVHFEARLNCGGAWIPPQPASIPTLRSTICIASSCWEIRCSTAFRRFRS